MPLIRNYGLKDPNAAAEFIAMTFDELDDVIDLVPGAWKEMECLRTEGRMISVRGYLMEYMAAAYARQDDEVFGRGCDTFVTYNMAKTSVVPPAAAWLSVDLAVAISRGDALASREVAAAILAASAPQNSEPAEIEARSAVVLASLVDLDYRRAEAAAALLKERCGSRDMDRLTSMIYEPWADAALGIARREFAPVVPAFQNIAHVQRMYIGRELSRWSRDQHTELSPADFWDWTTTALAGIGRDFGYNLSSGDTSWIAFADAEWTRGQVNLEGPSTPQASPGRG